MTDSSERKAFKDYFDREAASSLAEMLSQAVPDLDIRRFRRVACRDLDRLEMMDRVRNFSAAIREALPDGRGNERLAAYEAIGRSLPEPLPETTEVMDGYQLWPVGQYIAESAVAEMEPREVDAALDCMEQLTQRFTAEFAVRPFLEFHQDRVLARLQGLVEHESPHVRRWCSEGIRPRLPWGKRLALAPERVLEILEALRADSERYVQKSVANTLNDIAKENPDLVLTVAERWWSEGHDSTRWIVRHALRTLIKDGDPRALAVLGYGSPDEVDCQLSVQPETLAIGDTLVLEARLENRGKKAQPLLVDYVIHYRKANGSASAKVFKWTTLELAAGGSEVLSKKRVFRHASIRRLYPGPHLAAVQLNGAVVAEAPFELVDG